MVCYKCWTKVHIILELVMFNPCFLCLLPTYGGNVISHQETNKATTMAVTLVSELQDLMFSSQIPDLVVSLGDDNEAEVCIDTRDYIWTKSGEIREWRNCIPLRYNLDKFGGTSAK